MIAYDPDVIRNHADRLYFEATRAPLLHAFAAGIVALVAGLGIGLGLESWAAGLILGVALGAMGAGVGLVAGRSAAARMRLAAQTALCQVQVAELIARIASK